MSEQDTHITQPDESTISPSQQIHPLRNTHFAENLCWVPLKLVGDPHHCSKSCSKRVENLVICVLVWYIHCFNS